MIPIGYETSADFVNMGDVMRHVELTLRSFVEWAKFLVIETRGVTTGNSGLVLHKQFNVDTDSWEFWFSINPELWSE